MAQPRSLVELRVLDGPNAHLSHPAIQLRLDVGRLLAAPPADLADWAAEIDPAAEPGTVGAPATPARGALVGGFAREATRLLAARDDVEGLHVVTAPGWEDDELIVAFPWAREGRASTLGTWVAWIIDDVGRQPLADTLAEAADRLRRVPPGPRPHVPDPRVPTIGVTGTNGKTTTTRLTAFLAMACARRVAWNSTDGVYAANESLTGALLLEAGDYAGFGGAGRVLRTPGIDIAVVEIARGGLLRRGIGVRALDVGVVTNVTADHMGEMGVHTLDQLARVKSAVVRAVRPQGWAVLNAEDDRVAAMREGLACGVIVFAVDRDAPAVAATLAEGGRAVTVVDGAITMLSATAEPQRVVAVDAVPLTLSGLSRNNLANALAAAAAAWGAGLPREGIARGLRGFVPDAERNPGRLNAYLHHGRLVLVDTAHNPASLRSLGEVARGLTTPESLLHVVCGSIGDRSDQIVTEMGQVAADIADRLVLAEKHRYLRGRHPEDLLRLLRRGAALGGMRDVAVHPDEMVALDAVLAAATPGDVIAFAVHVHLPDIGRLMRERGATTATTEDISRWANTAARRRLATSTRSAG